MAFKISNFVANLFLNKFNPKLQGKVAPTCKIHAIEKPF